MSGPVVTSTALPVAAPAAWGPAFQGLGLTCDITTAARILGIGRTTAFELMRRGDFPVEVMGFGRVRRVRTADLFAYLRVGIAMNLTDQPDRTAPPGGADGVRHAA